MIGEMDHAVLLQTERSLEHLSDKVDDLEEKVEGDFCDCNCAEDGLDLVQGELKDLTARVDKLAKILGQLLED